MRKILISSASRAERGLLEPIMTELRKIPDVEAKWFFFNYETHDTPTVLTAFGTYLRLFNPDILLVPCDRPEAVHIAAHAFNNGFIVGQFHAGDVNEGTTDEMNRYAISFLSHILFCETEQARQNLLRMGFEPERLFTVGSTVLDNIEIDNSLCPDEPYDLVLLHPDTVSEVQTYKDIRQTINEIRKKAYPNVIWLEPNFDRNSHIIRHFLKQLPYTADLIPYVQKFTTYGNIPRPKFLGLLKHCSRAIGNSSALTFELPLLNSKAKLVKIGERNRRRNPPSTELGGSQKIAQILATIPIDDNLRRKRISH